ncbi:GRIM-19 protein-domain-containing protein [Phlebopus sp. FC_14]|nr:GRIM-19 protein-domain-containing protein [Phlebopus sp. FC_14]
MPPPGGFEPVKYKRNLPFRGPSGAVVLGAVLGVCAYGFYRVGKGNLERRELQREKVWSRIHLVPLLLAETDRDAYRRQQGALEYEKELMKDVKGWEVHSEESNQDESARLIMTSLALYRFASRAPLSRPRGWLALPPARIKATRVMPSPIPPSSSPATMSLPNYRPQDHQIKDLASFVDVHDIPSDPDSLIFGPLELEDTPLLSPYTHWDRPRDYNYNHPISPIMSDHTTSPCRASDFEIPDASPPSAFYDTPAFPPAFDEVQSLLDLDDCHLSQWLTEPHADPSSSSPIPIRGAQSDPQSPPSFIPYPDHAFPHNTSFSPDLAALQPLPRSLSPADGSDGYLSSPGLRLSSISPAETSLRPPQWASHLWDSSHYLASTSSGCQSVHHPPLSENPYTAKRQRFQPRRDTNPLATMFQSSSAPSPLQSNSPTMSRAYSRRADSVSVSDDRDATVRRKKKSPLEEPPKDDLSSEAPPLKSVLKQPKLAPSAWQLYFTDWIQRHQATSTRKLNVAQAAKEAGQEYANLTPEEKEPYKQRSLVLKQARERENAAYLRTLTPDDIKRENAFRTAQRKAGRSRKSNLKDPNAPKKPLSAYFMFLQRIRSDPVLVREIFGDEQETTKQSVLAAAKWRSMTDDERKPFLAQAEQEKLDYEAARRLYEEGTTGLGTNINFSILPGSPTESPFRALRNLKSEPFSSESESDGVATDDCANRYSRS